MLGKINDFINEWVVNSFLEINKLYVVMYLN